MSNTLRYIQNELSGHLLERTKARYGCMRYTYLNVADDVRFTVKVFYETANETAVMEAFTDSMNYSQILALANYIPDTHVSVSMIQY